VILYGLIVSTWFGLRQVKKDVGMLDNTRISYQDLSTIEEDVAIFALDSFAWVKRRLPMIALLAGFHLRQEVSQSIVFQQVFLLQ